PGGVGKLLDQRWGSRRIAWQSAKRKTELTGSPSCRHTGCSRRARAKSAYGSRRVASSKGSNRNPGSAIGGPSYPGRRRTASPPGPPRAPAARLAAPPGRATRSAWPLLWGARGGMERDTRPRRAVGAGAGTLRGGPAAGDRRTGAGAAGATGIALVLAERRAPPPHGALRRRLG